MEEIKVEVWKDIKGYENYYQISNYGRIKSKERTSNCCYGKKRMLKEKMIFPSKFRNGYLRIMLSKDKVKKRFYVHELVAQAFLDNYEKGKVVHHIDYNKENNYYKNLYVCTRKEHITIHNLADRLIKDLINNDIIFFDNGAYKIKTILTKQQYTANCYEVK